MAPAHRHIDRRTHYQRANDGQDDFSRFSDGPSSFGKPEKKRRIYPLHLAAATLSLACLALSILVIANDRVSWHLGVDNRQLIAIGFLVSVMNLCLGNVKSLFFILLEARFGESTVQNYDALLRNSMSAPRISFVWRMVLGIMLALPLGLSVAYKTFTGGESSMEISSTDYITNATFYGLFKPPGIITSTGISSFLNATTSFRDITNAAPDGSDPPLPTLFPQPYGHNILLLNDRSAAALDTPYSEYVLSIQKLLSPGESWTITAPVIGTVATLDEANAEETYQSVCKEAHDHDDKWFENRQSLFNGWTFIFTNRVAFSDQSSHYVGLAPRSAECEELPHYVYLYNSYRRRCVGTWSVSRGGFQLLNGSCDGVILPWAQQQILKWNNLALEVWYMPPLMETLGPFNSATISVQRGNESIWKFAYMATSVATMLWSRLGTLQVEFDSRTFNFSSFAGVTQNGTNLTYEDLGVIYPIRQGDQRILYNRQTLRKSPWLYLVLATQPVLTIAILLIISLLYSSPIGKGFNLISVLSGIDPGNLQSLAGASLSGALRRPVKLIMSPTKFNNGLPKIQYSLVTSPESIGSGEVVPNVVYH